MVDAATLAAAPLVATALGEFGAEVIKVEQPAGGDPLRTWGPRRDGIGLVSPVAVLSETPGAVQHLGRKLGADNDSVYGDLLGLDPARIAALRAAGTI